MPVRTLTAVLHKEENIYVATCPEVGTVSQGYSIEEAIANLKEANEIFSSSFRLFILLLRGLLYLTRAI
ncbi:MAG: type II toxin-antitoxin system HicB family antitoxin [Ktedonobacteraceae bacterium]|nr:type II toxin-antitoxin system HicB family antitoxin [Ktedonobacteraceae bacterium]